jgi:hypothetical protein
MDRPSPLMNDEQPTFVRQLLDAIVAKPSLIIFFCILSSIPLYWVFWCGILPLQDLPLHLANTTILARYSSSTFFQNQFIIKYFPYPYLLQDAILLPLLKFGSMNAAKILIALVFCLLLSGLWFFLSALNPSRTYLVFLAVPFLFNKLLFKGNINYLLGIAVFLFAAAFLWKVFHAPFKKRNAALLIFLSILLYFSHLVAFLLFLFVSGILVIWFMVRREWNVSVPVAGGLLAAAVLVFCAHLAGPIHAKINGTPLHAQQLFLSLCGVSNLSGKITGIKDLVTNFTDFEWYILYPLIGLWFFLMVGGLFDIRNRLLPFAVFASLLLLYLFSPKDLDPLIRPHERVFFLALFFSPACMGFPHTFRGKTLLHSREEKLFVLVVCLIVGFRMDNYMLRTTELFEPALYDTLACIRQLPPRGFLLPIFNDLQYFGKVGIVKHAAAYYVIEKEGLVPSLFSSDYMMVRYRNSHPLVSEKSPFDTLVLRHYDYLLVFGCSPDIDSRLANAGFSTLKTAGPVAVFQQSRSR